MDKNERAKIQIAALAGNVQIHYPRRHDVEMEITATQEGCGAALDALRNSGLDPDLRNAKPLVGGESVYFIGVDIPDGWGD